MNKKKEPVIATELCIKDYNELKEYAILVLNRDLESGVIENNTLSNDDLQDYADFIAERLHYGNTMNNVMISIDDTELKEFADRYGAFDEIEEGAAEEFEANKMFISDKIYNDLFSYCEKNGIKLEDEE